MTQYSLSRLHARRRYRERRRELEKGKPEETQEKTSTLWATAQRAEKGNAREIANI